MEAPKRMEPGTITRKSFITIIIVFIIISVGAPLVYAVRPCFEGSSARSFGEPKECTAIAINTKAKAKSFSTVTSFRTKDGKTVEVIASCKDYIGRKTTLLVYGNEACRQNYEFPKLGTIYIIVFILLAVGWIALITSLITKKIKIVKE